MVLNGEPQLIELRAKECFPGPDWLRGWRCLEWRGPWSEPQLPKQRSLSFPNHVFLVSEWRKDIGLGCHKATFVTRK